MRCCVCGKKESVFLMHRGKFCFVCEDCYQNLPTCVKESLPSLSAKDVRELAGVFQPSMPGIEMAWKRVGQVGISDTCLHIEQFQLPFRCVESAKLEFLQREGCRPELGGFWSTYGDICMVVTISGFRVRTLVKSARVFLTIRDAFPDFLVTRIGQVHLPEEVRILCVLINAGAKLVTHNLSGYRNVKFSGTSQHTEEQARDRSSAGGQKQEDRQQKESAGKRPDAALETALAYYGLSIPFTAETLKKKRNALIRKCHPDQIVRDGSLNPEDVNRFYDLLQRYAEKEETNEYRTTGTKSA